MNKPIPCPSAAQQTRPVEETYIRGRAKELGLLGSLITPVSIIDNRSSVLLREDRHRQVLLKHDPIYLESFLFKFVKDQPELDVQPLVLQTTFVHS